MATGVYLPIWGIQMEEGMVVKWLVSEGDRVEKGEPLVEIETEKITNVMESPASGILARIVAKEGEVVKITGLLAVILEEGDDQLAIEVVIQQVKVKDLEPEVQKIVTEVKEISLQPSASASMKVSPLAKKIAQEHSIDLTQIKGTGPEGRVIKEDVLAYVELRSKVSVKPLEVGPETEDKSFDGDIIPMTQTRKLLRGPSLVK
jgi:pyruvate/2-oxoglutarate dehydrogenase complex dihydrolipoamide acyltransferase (E2) component